MLEVKENGVGNTFKFDVIRLFLIPQFKSSAAALNYPKPLGNVHFLRGRGRVMRNKIREKGAHGKYTSLSSD